MNTELDKDPLPTLEYVRLNQLEKPQKTFFYQKKDKNGQPIPDTIFACNEQEAGQFGKKHILIGVSDGTTFYNHIRNSGVKRSEMIPIAKARQIMLEAFDAELAVAKGHFEDPKFQTGYFDNSFTEEQKKSFRPPSV